VPAFVALLRGVNVGKNKRVPMADWRAQLEALGYAEVTTLLNSGNAVFRARSSSARAHARAISSAIERDLKLSVAVVVKSSADLAAIVAANPYAGAPDHSRLLVAYTQESKSLAELAALSRLSAPPDEFFVGTHAAYLHCVGGILESKLASAMLGKAGASATTRNWATTLKIQALLDARA